MVSTSQHRLANRFSRDGNTAGFDPHVTGVDYDVLDRLIGYGIRRAQITLYDDFIRSLTPWDMTPPRFSALTIIAKNPDLKLTELASILGIARSGAVLLINTLEQMGLVERRPVPRDKRAYGLHLTARGQAILPEVSRVVQEHDARMSAHLTARERQTLLHLLHKLARSDG